MKYKGHSAAHLLRRMKLVVLRRVTALLAMIAIVALLLLLMWDVYLHHQHEDVGADEPAVVTLTTIAV